MRLSNCIFIALALLFAQCSDNAMNTEAMSTLRTLDYFPLSNTFHWRYLEENFTTGENPTLQWTDTTTLTVRGDTTLEGIIYKALVDQYGTVAKLVRKEGSKYYGRHHELYGTFTQEYLFLDEGAPLNSSWRHYKDGDASMTEYVVTAVDKDYSFNGIDHHPMIEMTVNYYYLDGGQYKLGYTVLHYYADSVGEVYASYPYPSISYSDLEISLLKYGVN